MEKNTVVLSLKERDELVEKAKKLKHIEEWWYVIEYYNWLFYTKDTIMFWKEEMEEKLKEASERAIKKQKVEMSKDINAERNKNYTLQERLQKLKNINNYFLWLIILLSFTILFLYFT